MLALFVILGVALALFAWGRWRYDLVALGALMAAVLAGVVPAGEAFAGFGHPAVVTVAAVLVVSRALEHSGLIDRIAAHLGFALAHPLAHLGALTGLGTLLSAFMNNVGALALLLPVALQTAASTGRSPAFLLMPLSFGCILGGLATLIGTPPNIIIATYRAEATGSAFRIFDFTPVGATLAIAGLAFITLAGWRLIPRARFTHKAAPGERFRIREYITEVRVPEGAPVIGKGVRHIEALSDEQVVAVGLLRDRRYIFSGARNRRLRADDVIVVEGDPSMLRKLVEKAGLALAGEEAFSPEVLRSKEVGLIEAVVTPTSRLVKRTFDGLRLRSRYGVNLIAIARQGRPVKVPLGKVRFKPGDVVLLQGDREGLLDTVTELGCLPLPERGLSLRRRSHIALPATVFGTAIAVAAVGWLPVHVTFVLAVCTLIALNVVPLRELYEIIDWPVIVLLGAMIPVGHALETTGGTELAAELILDFGAGTEPLLLLAALMVITMALSNIMNNAATAVVMAPIAASLAEALEASVDPFLMAVAVAASCAFMTPIGHQNNVLVMGPGGYAFADYWRMGLPLQALMVAIGAPLITLVWPL